MQHKLMVLFTALVLFGFTTAPVIPTTVAAQSAAPHCPAYDRTLLKEMNSLHALPPECAAGDKELTREANSPATAETITPAVAGGPDNFGYTFNNAVAFSWINATTNSGLKGDDQFGGPISLGFNFPFYGTPQTQLYFNTNGLITFGAGSQEWGPFSVPNDLVPNSFIAPLWDDLLVGSPYNSGAIYYARGGSAPNRYLVIEWRNVENYSGTGTFSFEAILYENGDILVQHKSLPSGYYSTVGIEDSSGLQGLQYQYGSSGLSAPRAIRFYAPTISTARVWAYAPQSGALLPSNGHKDLTITVTNPGNKGTDTYDLTSISAWPVQYYASNGTTLLTDTDADSKVDTGPIPQGASTTIISRFSTPADAQIGDSNTELATFTSSINASKAITVPLSMSVPAGFANVFEDYNDGAMSFLAAGPYSIKTYKATSNNYFGSDVAVAKLPTGNYLYAWSKSYSNGSFYVSDIEYAILSRTGTVILPPTKLTNHSGDILNIMDDQPAITVAPNGTVGVVWSRYLYDPSADAYNYNLYLATLNTSGTVLNPSVMFTNNMVWATFGTLNVPWYFTPSIAATSDNRFIIGWDEERPVSPGTNWYDVWYAVRNTDGTSAVSPTALTSNHLSWGSVLNDLTGGKAIMTWLSDTGGPYYAVINSTGTLFKPATGLVSNTIYWTPDAVQLSNGKVGVAWATQTGVQFAILNSSYNLESGPVSADSPSLTQGDYLSVTTDTSNHVIMTWTNISNKLFYALGDSTATFLTKPIVYKASDKHIQVGIGQWSAPCAEGEPVDIVIGTAPVDTVSLLQNEGQRASFSGVNNGPVQVSNRPGHPIIAAERVIYKVNNVNTSFTEMMGLPDSQLSSTYWFPWYNNVDLDTQLRMGNVSGPTAHVSVYIGDALVGGPITLTSGQSTRLSFSGVNDGPVKIVSDQNIVAAERVIYKVNNIQTSFTEMMGLPESQLGKVYWLPWYNNVDLDTQLRFANVSNVEALVHVFIGTAEMEGSPFPLGAGKSTRMSFPMFNNGPVKIESDQNIVAAERVIYKVNGTPTSFTETMALPNSQLSNTYWLPWYNNVDLDTQLRFANASAAPAAVHVYIGGTEITNGPIPLAPGQSTRISFVGVNNGPVKILSDVNIIAAERVIYKVNGVITSFSEMMGLPNSQLDTAYWLPWYNNVDLDTQLRFGMP